MDMNYFDAATFNLKTHIGDGTVFQVCNLRPLFGSRYHALLQNVNIGSSPKMSNFKCVVKGRT